MPLTAGENRAQDALFSHTLDTVALLVGAPVALGFAVDEHQTVARIVPRCAHPHDELAAGPLVQRLPELEPIDPFSPRRAHACAATVMWAADVGGDESLAASMYGRHLRRHGYGAPVFLYFRHAGSIASGMALLRTLDAAPFDQRTIRTLQQMQPFLEAALTLPAGKAPVVDTGAESAVALTTRETQVATLVADGCSNAAIAIALGMSEATVKTHLTKVYAKLGVRSRTQLAVLLPRPAGITDVLHDVPLAV